MDKEINILYERLNLPFKLRKYQMDGVKFLIDTKYCLLADEMGLGKTIQVIVAIKTLIRAQKINRALIVVPSSLKTNWSNELDIWAPELSKRIISGKSNRWAALVSPTDIIIASYQDINIEYSKNNIFEKYPLVVLDEAQKIKNPRSNIANKSKLIHKERGWILTGTPVENKKDDLCSLFDFLDYSLLNPFMSKSEIHSKIKGHFLRRKKSNVLKDMPPILEQTIKLKLSKVQERTYDSVIIQNKDKYNKDTNISSLFTIITELKQICNFDPETGISSKLDLLKILLDDIKANNKKVIIFSQYVKSIDFIKSNISNINTFTYTGKMSTVQKDSSLEKFKKSNESSLLLISLLAGGVGLNIKEADYVIMFDRWWNPALEMQAINRAHRFGRKTPLHVFYFLIENSIEEHILKIVSDKMELFKQYVDEAENKSLTNIRKEIIDYLNSRSR